MSLIITGWNSGLIIGPALGGMHAVYGTGTSTLLFYNLVYNKKHYII